ncbi:MAG: AI-2E family transporter [Parafilimonas sp.]
MKLPFYAHLALVLIILWFLFYGIYIGQEILLPLGFSFLIAVLLHPMEKLFERIKLPRVIAILLSLAIAVAVLFGLFTLLTHEIGLFMNDLPAIEKNISSFLNNAQQWISDTFHFSKQQQQQAIQNAQNMDNVKAVAGTTLGALTGSLATLTLIPIYTFLFMYYRQHLIMFTIKVFDKKHSETVARVVSRIRAVVQSYVSGLLIETACVAVLNCVGLLLIGVPYAILLGIIGAVLNLIPYIGGLIAIILTAIVTISNTGDIYITLGSLVVYLVVQFIDNNLLVPRIIGSSVQLNALVSILAVLIGGSLCGVGGMFLSLPFVAICKVVFDHVEELKPWGSMLGDEESARWNMMKMPVSKKTAAPKPAAAEKK